MSGETEVKKDLEWLKEWIEEYENKIIEELGKESTSNYLTTRLHGGVSALKEVNHRINQLDEPEVLSQKWIDDESMSVLDTFNRHRLAVPVDKLQNLLVPKQEEVKRAQIPEWIIEWYQGANNELSTLEDVFDNLSHDTDYNIMDSEKLRSHIMKYGGYSKMYEALSHIYFGVYEIEEEQKYFAKIKGHENIDSDDKYWNYCITDESLDIGDNKVHADVLAEYVLSATKDDWNNLGINEHNADFVLVEELEE